MKNSISRRGAISAAAIAAGGLAANPIPCFAGQTVGHVDSEHNRKLVVLFLEGGNDGLNMIVPYADPLYRRYRDICRIDAARVVRLTTEHGFHPSMRALTSAWENGKLAIVQGVGYPNHSRSHFVSQAVWHTAQLDARLSDESGWLGRCLDDRQLVTDDPLAFNLNSLVTPLSLRGRRTRTATVPAIDREDAGLVRRLLEQHERGNHTDEQRQYVRRLAGDACESLGLWMQATASSQKLDFPSTVLGQSLARIAWLILSGNPAVVYFATQPGYDTHAGQAPRHASLLSELADGLAAFDRVLTGDGLAQDVAVVVVSEFGRRIQENVSGGTDHGAAGPVLILGGGYKPGLHGKNPDLADLENGDLRVTTDFRSVYATLLRNSLEVNSAGTLPAGLQPMGSLLDV